MRQNLHLVWNPAAAGQVRQMLHKLYSDESQKHQIISFWEEFCVGPSAPLNSKSKRAFRKDWFKKVFGKAFSDLSLDHSRYSYLTKSRLEKSRVYLWQGPSLNSSFLCGQLLQFFEDKKVKPEIFLVKVKGPRPYRRMIGEMESTASLKPYQTAKRLELKDKKYFLDLNKQMLASDSLLRIKKGASGFQNVDESFYDQKLTKIVALRLQEKKGWVSDIDVISYFLSEQKDFVPMDFIHYRLKELCKSKKLLYKGSLLNRRYGRIFLKVTGPVS